MALRPFAFGVRLRDKNRTLRVRGKAKGAPGFVVEDTRSAGKTRRREHDSLAGALRDAATSWRNRLH